LATEIHAPARIYLEHIKRMQMNNLKILLVDDQSDLREVIKIMLRRLGADVESAENGQDGFKKAMYGEFDLIFMDLEMPVMDGMEATKLLRNRGYSKPIIAISANHYKLNLTNSLDPGFNARIPKPFGSAEIKSALKLFYPKVS
jgi:CheY-like chemotaxis protein